jgi:predicted ferric reductase
MKKINSVIYGLFGAGAIAYGAAALLSPAVLESNAAQSFRLAHILSEQGAAAIFVGLMAFWCIFNYEHRRVVHYFLMVFAFLLAAIHWRDHFAGHLSWMSPLYNTVPFAVLLAMAALDRPSQKGTTG